KALLALKNQEISSVWAAARQFKVSHSTLMRRHRAGNTQATSHEMQQLLTNAEELTFVRWIKQYTIT
ncbi:hypothetical protein EV356DRAFT_423138, partial [Viridothelium virens]